MKNLNKIMIRIFAGISLLVLSVNGEKTDVSDEDNERQTKSYENETFSPEEYYEMGLKGELVRNQTKKEPLMFSSLKSIREKGGITQGGGVYEDANGGVWIVKKGQNPTYEYLGSKVMDLLIGPFSPEIKLLSDKPNYTASKLLPGFVTENIVKGAGTRHKYKDKPIIGGEKIEVAMDLMGLGDRHGGNQGYIDMGDRLEAARVDFDHAFQFYDEPREGTYSNSEALESIVNIPDEMILYVLGDAYQDLWETGYPLNYIRHQQIGPILIARKHELKDILSERLEYEELSNKIKNNLSLHTKEDYERLSKLIFDLNHEAPLVWAVNTDEPDIVRLFLDNGADINVKNKDEETLLHLAAAKDNLEIVRLLLEKGANPDSRDKWKATPIKHAIFNDNLEMVRLLLDNGVNIDNSVDDRSGGPTLLHLAAAKENLDMINLLLDRGADVNAKDHRGATPLYWAARQGKLEAVRLLLDKGADPNAKVNKRNDIDNGKTALDIAKENNYTDIVSLLEKGQEDDNRVPAASIRR